MKSVLTLMLCVLLACALSGCAQKFWHAKAYDLSGNMIYEGEIKTKWWKADRTIDGKQIQFHNATLILVEK